MTTPDEDIVRVLARQVIMTLEMTHSTLAVAESSTGGLIGHLLTEVEGCSAVYFGGTIAYANQLKEKLGVPRDMLDKYGAVSPEVAAAMARGVRDQAGAGIGLAVTGIAGPNGGTPAKPAGLTYIALADETRVTNEVHRFSGERARNKLRSAEMALQLVQKHLMEM